MSKQIAAKYFEESEFAKEPCRATEASAGYDLYAAETKTFLPNSADTVSLDLGWASPTRFFGKLFPRSSILKDHLVTVDADVIDADFRGIVQALLVNHHCFFRKIWCELSKGDLKSLLGAAKRVNGGFGSTGLGVIKKLK